MAQCEMCGAETSSPRTVKIEGAELDVCDSCAGFGTEVREQGSESTSTKYSTGSSGSSGRSGRSGGGESGGESAGSGAGESGGGSGSGGSRSGSRRPDPFDDDTLAQDYDDRLREAREGTGLSQADLAKELNEKASLIRKLERGEMLPSNRVQKKLERRFDIDLTEEGAEDTEWEGGASTGSYTFGDVVKRKDS
jgi:putative transcription factor